MKKIVYECDRCGKEIAEDGIYEITVERINKDGHTTEALPDDVFQVLQETTRNKQICKDCMMYVMKKAYKRQAAVENPDFAAAVENMEKSAKTDKAETQETSAKPASEPLATNQDSGPKEKKQAGRKPKIAEDELRDLVENQNMSVIDIASKLDISDQTVRNYMERYKIKRVDSRTPVLRQDKCLTVENVMRVYVQEGKDIKETSEELGTTMEDLRRFIIKNKIFKSESQRAAYEHSSVNDNKDK